MASTVSAVCPPQRWPAGSGVGGALVQSHPCRAPVQGGGGGFIVIVVEVGFDDSMAELI